MPFFGKLYFVVIIRLMQSIEIKQNLLRQEVLQAGLDAQQFIEYIGKIKGQGDNVDLENWSVKELKDAIALFKDDINKSKLMVMSSRISLRDYKKSKIFDNSKKEKVTYENSGLWDFQVYEQQECQKAEIVLKLPQNDDPRVAVQKAQIKSVGGFIFGLGARNELQVTISTNFTPNKIVRKGEQVDWLRSVLITNFPGWYVPPLQPERELNTDDKKGIASRKNQIQVFLNKVVKYSIFQTSQQLKVFFEEQNAKKFHEYKSRESFFGLERDTQGIATLSGKLHIEISDKINKTLKHSTQISSQINTLYNDFQSCVGKILGEMQRIEKYTKMLSEITAKLSQKYGQAQKLLKIESKMPTMFLSFNNISTNVSKNIRRHIKALNELNENYIREISKDWNEFIVNDNKVQKELKRYLAQKQNLIRKKQKYLGDITRWQLPQSDFLQLKNKDLSKMPREQKMNKMFPSQNQIEMRYRIWLAHVNHSFLQGFKIFLSEQQKTLINSYMQYSGEATCLNTELVNNFNEFNQMIFQ